MSGHRIRLTLKRRQTGIGTPAKISLVLVVAVLIGAFFLLDLGEYANLAYLKSVQQSAADYVAENPLTSRAGYFFVYILVTGLSLPGAAVMTLAGGAIFGLVWGVLLVSFASSIGASIAMLISRSLLRDWVLARFGEPLKAINEGFERDGAFYLFGLRMVPLFPFFVVNLVMGLAPISLWQFYWVSQLGMLAATVVFVFAGTQLAGVESIGDVLSPGMVIALSLLGLFPIIARKLLELATRLRSKEA